MHRWFAASFILLATTAGSQLPRNIAPQPMPADRADDSYAIYSALLASDQIEWQGAPRSVWLVEQITTSVPGRDSCQPGHDGGPLNPHSAVQAPPGHEHNLQDLLADFDLHCHKAIRLDAKRFSARLPVHALDINEQARFRDLTLANERSETGTSQVPAQFTGAAGMQRFSEVYFNPDHTVALTEFGVWCGSLCGNETWVALEKQNGKWAILPWTYTSRVS